MHGQHLIGADNAGCHLGDALDFGAHLRVHCLAGEEALTFICKERCSRGQHHADPQRGDTVEACGISSISASAMPIRAMTRPISAALSSTKTVNTVGSLLRRTASSQPSRPR